MNLIRYQKMALSSNSDKRIHPEKNVLMVQVIK